MIMYTCTVYCTVLYCVCFQGNSHQTQNELTVVPWLHFPWSRRISTLYFWQRICFVIDMKMCLLIGSSTSNRKTSVNCVWSVHFSWIFFLLGKWKQVLTEMCLTADKGGKVSVYKGINDMGIFWFLPHQYFILNGHFLVFYLFLFSSLTLSLSPFPCGYFSDILHVALSSETSGSDFGSPICKPCF